jgi:hypothetical protein
MKLSVTRWAASVVSLTGVVSLGMLLAGSLDSAMHSSASAAGDPSTYKPLFATRCSACHNLPDPTVTQNTRERWRALVTIMSGRAAAAGAPISDDDQAHIVDYLGLFPPKAAPGSNDPLATKHDDVWATDPERSLVYTFYTPSQLAQFRQLNAIAGPAANAAGIVVTPRSDPGLVVHTGDPLSGGLDLRAQIRLPDSAGASRAAGVVFGFTSPRDYFAALLDLSKGEVRIVKAGGGEMSVVSAIDMGDIDLHSDWHTIRVMYRPEHYRVSVWVDAGKKLVTDLPDYTDGGQFGLIAAGSTRTGFRNLYADIYGE